MTKVTYFAHNSELTSRVNKSEQSAVHFKHELGTYSFRFQKG